MADVINLRLVRKRKARVEKDEQAAGNRVKFGQTKAERKKREAVENLAAKRLDGHKRDLDR